MSLWPNRVWANGYAYKADTLEELADVYGINKENLLKTVADYNECKASGGQDPFNVPNEYMVSMTTPPYYMSLFDPSMNTNCLMGLACDEYCRLLTEDGTPIENLYGVGELIMGNVCGGTKQGARYPALRLLPRCRHLRRPHRSAAFSRPVSRRILPLHLQNRKKNTCPPPRPFLTAKMSRPWRMRSS